MFTTILQADLEAQGVIYTDIETAMVEHEQLFREYFMTLIKPERITNLQHFMVPYGLVGHLYMCRRELGLICLCNRILG